jgi:aryl-alcohol dehydrogenase-like predicted oxidoreductase
VERIPIYLVHWPDSATPIRETMEALEGCRRAGKIGHIGLSNFAADQIAEAHRIAPVSVVEVSYNLLDRRAEQDVLPLCAALGIAVIAYGVLAQGLLSGKYCSSHRFGPNDRRARLPHFQPDAMPNHLETVTRLERFAHESGRTAAQVAIRWVLDQPGITAAIAGAKSPRQVQENIQAAEWRLTAEQREYLTSSEEACITS